MVDNTTIFATLGANSLLAWVGWIATLSFGAALIVLFRTRWRNANAILKCVVLSLYAHLILVMAAYGTRIFSAPSSGQEEATISVHLLDDDELNLILAEADAAKADQIARTGNTPTGNTPTGNTPTGNTPTDNTPKIDAASVARNARALEEQGPLPENDFPNEASPENDPPENDPPENDPPENDPPENDSPENNPASDVASLPSPPPPTEPESDQGASTEVTDSPQNDALVDSLQGDFRPDEPQLDDPQDLADTTNSTIIRPDPQQDLKFAATPTEEPSDLEIDESNSIPTPTQLIRRPISSPSELANPRQVLAQFPGGVQPQPLVGSDRASVEYATSATTIRPVARRVGPVVARPARYRKRSAEHKRQALLEILGHDDALVSVERALQWLQRHQESDGSWNPQRHGGGRESYAEGQNRGGAGMNAETGMTGLALLAFVGAGHDHTQGPYRETIAAALDYLIEQQRFNGDLSGEASLYAAMYCHGMAALALAEFLAYTSDDQLRGPVEKAVQFTIRAQDPTTGSWRYAAGDGQGDMSQFGWQVMFLTTAELSGITIPETTRYRMTRFVDQMSSGRDGGLSQYQRGHRPSRTMTAESLVCRQFLGIDVPTAAEREGFDFIAQERPGPARPGPARPGPARLGPIRRDVQPRGSHVQQRAESKANLYYWYYGSLAHMQYRSTGWKSWIQEMESTLLARQQDVGDDAGSWAPDTKWGDYGGRVYSTALAALCLEVFYRYDKASADSDIPHWTRQDGRWGPLRR